MRDDARGNGEQAEPRLTARAVELAEMPGPSTLTTFTFLVALFVACGILAAVSKAVSQVWVRLGARGRLIAGMVASFPTAIIAGNAGLIPNGDTAALIYGLAGVTFFGAWLRLWGRYSRRRWGRRSWRKRRGVIVPGSLDVHVAGNGTRIGELEARAVAADAEMEELRQTVAMLTRTLTAIGIAANVGIPEMHQEPRHLRLVGSDARSMPGASSL
jgi:hypothetical protein